VKSRFVLDLRVGPRTLDQARELVASVAWWNQDQPLPLLLMDEHLPYPQAILDVFGQIKYRRRRTGRGRFKYPTLKPPPDLQVGVVRKQRDERGNILKVTTYALFGRKKQIERRIQKLGVGTQINTSHLERLNGTIRGQQARLIRRTRSGSRREDRLGASLYLWRDLYNWTRRHYGLFDTTPAMALGLAESCWTTCRYVNHPVHLSPLQQEEWAEQRNTLLLSALEVYNRNRDLPIS
jgi:hypothetical protein